jgi:hypothetical protein
MSQQELHALSAGTHDFCRALARGDDDARSKN